MASKAKGGVRGWTVQKSTLKRSAPAPAPRRPPPPPAPLRITKKVNWLNRQGYFGKRVVDDDALEMLGTLPEDRAMVVLENLEAKAESGEIWNPNSYVVSAVIRHSNQLNGAGKGGGGAGYGHGGGGGAPHGGGGGGGGGSAPAPVPVLKKVNWLNREGFFGKEAIDEDAVEMLGTLPLDRAMTILENIEEKATVGEIWNPNSYVVKAVVRHSQNLKTLNQGSQGNQNWGGSQNWGGNQNWGGGQTWSVRKSWDDGWTDRRGKGNGKASGTALAVRSSGGKGKGKSKSYGW